MKAITRNKYGGPEVLEIQELPSPSPKKNELLIRVHACTVNRTDCGILWARPAIIRLFTGLFKPKMKIPGTDFAGEVVSIGKNVKLFKVGDKVWGFDDSGIGSHAPYLCIGENKPILSIPEGFTYAQAAASAEGAHYAYNFVNKINLNPTHKVMINGATGAIGSAALQFLKYYGLYVTATCRTEHIAIVKSMGADKVIDYTQEDFTTDEEKYDFVFDSVGKSRFDTCKAILKPEGIYISSELGPGNENPLLAISTSFRKGQKVKFPIPLDTKKSLGFIKDLAEQGKFKPLIDRTYPMEQTKEAYTYVASGQKVGNVIISFVEEQ